MAGFREEKTRNVIPNWRSFSTTAKIGEINGTSNKSLELYLFPIQEYIDAWLSNKTIPFASDLISAAITNGQSELPEAKKAAQYILENQDKATSSQINTAFSILYQKQGNDEQTNNYPIQKKLVLISNEDDIAKEKIRVIKNNNKLFQYNPIAYCELSWNYTILGNFKKAESAMDIAVHLAPQSRYVSRSAARLYLHIEEYDKAHNVVVNNPWLKTDPWLLASEIAINSLQGRNSRFIKVGKSIINSNNYSPNSISELAGAIGTVELINGSVNNCKTFFKKGLIQPNDNCLAQAKWLVSEVPGINMMFSNYDYLTNKYEADSRWAYYMDQYDLALLSALDWISDMPFTKRPIQFASEMAYTYLHDYDTAISILKTGLVSNPNDIALLNNLAYSYSLAGKTNDSDQVLSIIKIGSPSLSKEIKLCLYATKGLNEYRKNNVEKGVFWYEKAIDFATKNKCDKELINKAKLNYFREQVRADSSNNERIIQEIEAINSDNSKELKQLKKDVVEEIAKRKNE